MLLHKTFRPGRRWCLVSPPSWPARTGRNAQESDDDDDDDEMHELCRTGKRPRLIISIYAKATRAAAQSPEVLRWPAHRGVRTSLGARRRGCWRACVKSVKVRPLCSKRTSRVGSCDSTWVRPPDDGQMVVRPQGGGEGIALHRRTVMVACGPLISSQSPPPLCLPARMSSCIDVARLHQCASMACRQRAPRHPAEPPFFLKRRDTASCEASLKGWPPCAPRPRTCGARLCRDGEAGASGHAGAARGRRENVRLRMVSRSPGRRGGACNGVQGWPRLLESDAALGGGVSFPRKLHIQRRVTSRVSVNTWDALVLRQ